MPGEARTQRERERERAAANMAALDDEYRICARCGWQVRKSVALAQGITRCQRCGHDRCVGASLPFDFGEG